MQAFPIRAYDLLFAGPSCQSITVNGASTNTNLVKVHFNLHCDGKAARAVKMPSYFRRSKQKMAPLA